MQQIATAQPMKPAKPLSAPGNRRNRQAIHLKMSQLANAAHGAEHCEAVKRSPSQCSAAVGLTLRDLEDRRWCVSPPVAKERLRGAGLPYEGRRAGLIYSWASIFRAEGIDEKIAKSATQAEFPDLFDDLVDTSSAASLLGYKDPSSIRKLIGAGDIPQTAYIQFGSRGIYRFRQTPLMALRKASPMGRIV
ncbi:hypothetical protein JQX09_23545 [Sulfitobacter pseudonitzschiae]|uniref:Uncharacterized protein n=1 Tax=Pseudosulfitobacter pseudonitzschiae TaxID=1402135 RepID=A0A9Q2NN22_9RHOB|nr:hypothetical protein [Pseudosulfitobacter pseudonitzschiae]MBM2294907.1 hypothetical protein [Pseudosulfitobacter pseudonitzschiae]MBM2299823.1 hypothetical protein [Pseudosulfitobacter pseudonitzschiae]MBM2304744.1 hypothetical protein [Pseudosulfitobacter pseudonitzschiae]MBM2314518.1 hypothetical protein [Pseudosulfitobacter pseudonitzschiae]MBM2319428.1 hypothetical protein [Pseudosulfitobacter pseudonitzschiae]